MKLNFKTRIAYFLILLSLAATGINLNAQTLDTKINSLISKMSLEDKVKQLHHEGGFNTATNYDLGIPGFVMSDGPHGVRYGLATSFPVGMGLAATWDTEIVYRVGRAMGKEFRAKGVHQALGPCLDLTLDPRNGRSPESTGEDPFLNGKINTAIVLGIQSTPALATIKHFFSEYRQAGRTSNDYTLSQRNLLEQFGFQFRDAVQIGGSFSVMSSYNKINGLSVAKNPALLTTDLRNKWGFPFYVVSDWNSIYSNPGEAVTAGCDIEMGSDYYQNSSSGLLSLVKSGKLSESVINLAVKRVLTTKYLAGMMNYYPQGNPDDVNSAEHQALCLEAGKKGLVLLKNENGILPLNKNSIKKLAVIGPNAAVMQTDGSGSSWVDPFYKISPKQGIENYIGESKVLYAKGCDISGTNYASDVNLAINYAAEADAVIFFGGLDASQEGEGFDRVNNSIELPGKQKELINYLSKVNSNIIVVLISGGICTVTPFVNDAKAILYGFYPGQEGGNAIAQTLFGDYNPGGKLPVTMPRSDSQMPDRMSNNLDNNYGGGYRWFDRKNFSPQYAFGFGLSYTTFSIGNLSLSADQSFSAADHLKISVDVTNTGSRAGEEVVQLYAANNSGALANNVKDLKGFRKVFLEPAQTQTVTFDIGPNELYYFDPAKDGYVIDPGQYTFYVGNSSDSLALSRTIELKDDIKLPDLQIANIYTIPRYPVEGDTVIFLATVVNYGTAASPENVIHEIDFRVDGITVSRAASFAKSIPTGGMALISGSLGVATTLNGWIAGKPGSYKIEAVVNGSSIISEGITVNNSKPTNLVVYENPPENIALGKQVTISSIESFDYVGDMAVDGNYGTRWSSAFSDPQTFELDLGSVRKFNLIKIFWETAYGKDYSIEVSENGTDWTKIISQQNGSGGAEQWKVDASARYIRLTGTKRGTQYGYSIYEFEVYNIPLTGINDANSSVPMKLILENNYPNPFNPETTIKFSIPDVETLRSTSLRTELKIYDILGRKVATLVNERKSPGNYEIKFNASGLPSGVYIYTLRVGDRVISRKMTLLK